MSTPAPDAASQEPPKQFPFIIPPSFKKLHSIDTQGEELFADENLWVRMQLKDPFEQATSKEDAPGLDSNADDAAGQQTDEEAINPFEVMGLFNNAKRELEWLQLMLQLLKSGKYLTVGRVERPPVPQRMMDLAVELNSRYKRRTAAAAAASASLAEGAAALQALGSREDAFYLQVAQLQKYWKVKQEPPDSPYAYTVNLKLSSSNSSEDANLAAAAAMIGRGPVSVVPILKDSNGMLRVQVPAPRQQQQQPTVMNKEVQEPPTVYTGPAAIHALLLQQLRLNAWHLLLQSLNTEITQRLGLPARMQPSRAAAAASSSSSNLGDPAAVAAVAAAGTVTAVDQGPDRQASNSTGSTAAAAAAGGLRHLLGNSSSTIRPAAAAAAGAGSHFTFYAALSNLVLQAVMGSAATAGEDALLEQQQQSTAAAAVGTPRLEQQQQQQRGVSPVDHGSLSVGSLTLELDVGGPWERAAAAAAAAAGSSNGSLLYQPSATASGSSSSSVVLDPQLLSLRPFALQHLLITQLGHLITKSYYQDSKRVDNAAIAFAAAAREQQQRHLQRQQQAGLSAAAAASSSSSRPTVLMLPAVSFMTCLSRWLAHSSSRELTRTKVDNILLHLPGIIAKTLPCCHSCNSVIALQPSKAAARSAATTSSSSNGQPQQQQQQQQLGPLVAAPVLLLMSDAGLVLEGAGLGVSELSSGLGQHGRCRDVQQSVNHLVALPKLLQPLLKGMQQQ